MSKKTKLVKCGNSLVAPIPHEIIDQLNLKNDQKLTIETKKDAIVLIPNQSKPQDIHELFQDWEDDGIREKELDWGDSHGNEFP